MFQLALDPQSDLGRRHLDVDSTQRLECDEGECCRGTREGCTAQLKEPPEIETERDERTDLERAGRPQQGSRMTKSPGTVLEISGVVRRHRVQPSASQ